MHPTKRLWHKNFSLVIIAILFLTVLPQQSTSAISGVTNETLQNPDSQVRQEQGRVKRVESTLDELVLEVNIEDLSMQSIEVNGLGFTQLALPFSGNTGEVGKPELPTFGQFFAVPNGAQMQVEVLIADSKTIDDVLVYPAQEPMPDCTSAEEGIQESSIFAHDTDFYAQDVTYPGQVVTLDPVTSIRGVHASIARFNPVQYNPALKQLTVYSYIKVRITFTGGTRTMGDLSKRAEAFENIYSSLFINYDLLEPVDFASINAENMGGGAVQFLIITHPNFESAANLLDAARESQGIATAVITTTTTGSTAAQIQAYIQNAYDSWSVPPEYVLLLGDAEYIPTNYVTPHPYHDDELIGTDLYYATVDGSDYDADILMGRISVDSLSQATSHINRIINYPVSGTHYDNIAMAAYFQDYDNYDGYEDRMFVLTSEMIRNYMLTQNYDVQRIYNADSDVTPTHWNDGQYSNGGALPAELLRSNGFAWDGDSADITNAVNAGVLIMQHRDHGAIYGWGDPYYSYDHVNALTNGDKQPVVLSMNCQTGWFDNETDYNAGTTPSTQIFSESWERNPNGGAVGVVAATRVTYSGYNDYLTMGMYDAIWPNFLSYNNSSFDRPEYRMSAALNYGKLAMRALWYSSGTYPLIETEMFHWFGDPTMYLGQFRPVPKNGAYLPLVMKAASSVGGFNGDFELGPVSWSAYSSSGDALITNTMPVPPHSGAWLAKFGQNDYETDQIWQDVLVPAANPYLGFWYWIDSGDVCGYDYFRVLINGNPYQIYDLCDDNSTGAWMKGILDLSAYAGSTVTLMFQVTTDSSLSSNLYLDDISFQSLGQGFNSQFTTDAYGWQQHVGDWYLYLDSGWYYTHGVSDISSSVSYTEYYANFDYQVRMWRFGGDYFANRIIIRGNPDPLQPDGHWHSELIFQYDRNGAFSVFREINGVVTALQDWTSSSAINTGDAWNTLRVIADGSNLYYYINGTLVWVGADTSLTYGRVGIGMYWDALNPGTDLDALWVDYAVLSPFTIQSGPIADTISPEQQALNEAANLNPGGNENQAPID